MSTVSVFQGSGALDNAFVFRFRVVCRASDATGFLRESVSIVTRRAPTNETAGLNPSGRLQSTDYAVYSSYRQVVPCGADINTFVLVFPNSYWPATYEALNIELPSLNPECLAILSDLSSRARRLYQHYFLLRLH